MKFRVDAVTFMVSRNGEFAKVLCGQETANGSWREFEVLVAGTEGEWLRKRIGKTVDLKAEDT